MDDPVRIDNPDWDRVIELAADALDEANNPDSDIESYIFEAVLEAVYGSDIWSWWNIQQ